MKNRFNAVVFDIETYRNIFTLTAISVCKRYKWVFEISARKNNIDELFSFLEFLAKHKIPMIGFNNLGFDYPVLHWIIKNRKKVTYDSIYHYAQEVINSYKESRFGKTVQKRFILIPQIDLYLICHFDNKARATSLKMLAFNMRFRNLQELPYSPHEPLTFEQMDEIVAYNINDVLVTLEFYNQCIEAITLRSKLSEKYGIDFTNMNDGKIGGEIFIQEIEKANPNSCYTFKNGRREINQTKRSFIPLKDVILPYVKFERPEFKAILKWFEAQIIRETNGVFSDILESDLGDVAQYANLITKKSKKMDTEPTEEEILKFKQQVPFAELEVKELKTGKNKKSYFFTWKVAKSLNVVINGHEYIFGTGGIHSSVESQIITSDNEYCIIDLDVASFYPHLSIQNNVYPKHLGLQFCKTYLNIYNERKSYAKNTSENLALKYGLNVPYGNSNNQYSPFYDPQYTMTITINGQMSLCMLIERILKLEGATSVQSNTDGITMRVKRTDSDKVNQIVKKWEKETKLEMERNDYSKMYIRDVNSYVAVYTNGKTKLKGAYVVDLEMHKDQSSIVIQKAVEAHLSSDTPIEDFIKNHNDKFDFMLRTKVPKSSKLVSVSEDGSEQEEQNITRYYVSNSAQARSLVKVMPPTEGKTENRRIGVCVGKKVIVCNNILDYEGSIDYDYYIAEAKKLADVFNPIELESE